MLYYAKGMRPESDATIGELIAHHADENGIQIARAFAYRGEKDKAFEWLYRSLSNRDAGLSEIVADPFIKHLEDDPRWDQFLRKLNIR